MWMNKTVNRAVKGSHVKTCGMPLSHGVPVN